MIPWYDNITEWSETVETGLRCVCVCVFGGGGGDRLGGVHNNNTTLYSVSFNVLFTGQGHPMKPHRISLTHSLVLHYGLHKKMKVKTENNIKLFEWLILLWHWHCNSLTLKPVLNWVNVCSPNILRTVRWTMICFLIELLLLVRWTWFGVWTVQTLLHSQMACNEMQAPVRTCGRQHDRKCRLKSSQYTFIIPHRVLQLILGVRDKAAPPTS